MPRSAWEKFFSSDLQSFPLGWRLASLLQVLHFCLLFQALSHPIISHWENEMLTLRSIAHQWARCLWVTVSFLKTTAPAECRQGLSQVSTLMNIPRCLCVVSQNQKNFAGFESRTQKSSIPMTLRGLVGTVSSWWRRREMQDGHQRPCGRTRGFLPWPEFRSMPDCWGI